MFCFMAASRDMIRKPSALRYFLVDPFQIKCLFYPIFLGAILELIKIRIDLILGMLLAFLLALVSFDRLLKKMCLILDMKLISERIVEYGFRLTESSSDDSVGHIRSVVTSNSVVLEEPWRFNMICTPEIELMRLINNYISINLLNIYSKWSILHPWKTSIGEPTKPHKSPKTLWPKPLISQCIFQCFCPVVGERISCYLCFNICSTLWWPAADIATFRGIAKHSKIVTVAIIREKLLDMKIYYNLK